MMRFRPSSASRWLACPGSVPLSDGLEDKASSYAAEGTVAHALAEDCQRLELDPSDFVGGKRTADGFEIEISEEMAEAVRVYLDIVREISSRPGVEVFIETTTDVPDFFVGLGDLYGTIDFMAIEPDPESPTAKKLTLVDLKYGQGVKVEAEGNKQLLTYAAIATDTIEQGPQTVSVVEVKIVQPRSQDGDPVRSATFSLGEILDHVQDVRDAATLAAKAEQVKGSQKILDYLAAGDHCRWCPVKASCPKLHAKALEDAKSDFGEPLSLEPATELTTERLVYWLENAKLFRDWLSSIEELAKTRAEQGEEIPGFKLVESIANRRWDGSDDEIEKKLRKLGFKKADLYETKLVSPAQAEKAAPTKYKKAEAKEFVDALTVRPVTGLSLVPESDKRPRWIKSTPEEDFGKVG